MNKIKIKLKNTYGGWEVYRWRISRWVHWLPPVSGVIRGEEIYGEPYKSKELAIAAAKKAKAKEAEDQEEILEI